MAKWKSRNNCNGGNYYRYLTLPPEMYGPIFLTVYKTNPWVRGGWAFEVWVEGRSPIYRGDEEFKTYREAKAACTKFAQTILLNLLSQL